MKNEYHSRPEISNSQLSKFKRSPKHYLHSLTEPEEPTAEMNLGTLIHCLVLEPHTFDDTFFLIDDSQRPEPSADYRNAKNRDWKAAKMREAEGRVVIGKNEYHTATKAKEALVNDEVAWPLISAGENVYESEIYWSRKIGVDNMNFRGKIDIRNPEFICDLKTSKTADPSEFRRTILQRDYHRQLAMYLDGDVGGKYDPTREMKPAFIIAVETSKPYGVSVHKIMPELILKGFQEYLYLAQGLQTCMKSGRWPGYEFRSPFEADGIFEVGVPKWMENE